MMSKRENLYNIDKVLFVFTLLEEEREKLPQVTVLVLAV